MVNANVAANWRASAHVQLGADKMAWPTVWLFFILLALGAANVFAALNGVFPLWAAGLVNLVIFYVMEHINHEAIHANISGADAKYRWLNDLIGHVGNFWLFLPYPAFRAVHFAHHRMTNDKELDGDMWFARRTILGVVLSCCTLLIGYEIRLQRLARRGLVSKRDMATIYATRIIWLSVAAGLAYLGFGREVLLLWVAPALLAMPVLAFLFAFSVHHPHTESDPIRASNVLLGRGVWQTILSAIYLNQNYHLVHHLHPRIPFFKYGRAFRQIRAQLESKNAPIKTVL